MNKKMYILILSGVLIVQSVSALELTLRDAVNLALGKSNRGAIIEGDLEVARQKYSAERINFYVPDISINGSLPFYSVSESFDYLPSQPEKSLNRRTNLNFDADITLKQSLITGGEFTVQSKLYNRDADLPQVFRIDSVTTIVREVNQVDKQGQVDFSFSQPLLKPSAPKNELKNKRDDLALAELTKIEEMTTLKKEVVDAYFGVLQTSLQYEIDMDKTESAKIQKHIDSSKFNDGILSEEDWLTSASNQLDAELDLFDKENEQLEKRRELYLLLDIDFGAELKTSIPVVTEHVNEIAKERLINRWEYSIPIQKARISYDKVDREADFTASSHGLTGTLEANYSLARGDVELDGFSSSNNTDSWGLTVNFTFPLWDGGAKGAEIKAARLSAKKSLIEYEKAKKSAKAELTNLVNKLDISFKKLSVLTKQIDLANEKLKIAKFRLDDGQISRLEFLESKIYYLETQDKYLEELKIYFNTKFDLEGKYTS